jgi:hypothetical protein
MALSISNTSTITTSSSTSSTFNISNVIFLSMLFCKHKIGTKVIMLQSI